MNVKKQPKYFASSITHIYRATVHLSFIHKQREDSSKFTRTQQDSLCTYFVTLRCLHPIIVAVEKSINVSYSEFIFVASGIHHTVRLRRVVCVLPRSTILSTWSHKRHDFRRKMFGTWNACFDLVHNFCPKRFSFQEEMLVLIWSITSARNVSHSKKKCVFWFGP